MPRPVEALPCGSRSTISTRSPIAASAVPRLIAVVVLPTPPFWLATTRMRGFFGLNMTKRPNLQNNAGRPSFAGVLPDRHTPRYTSFRQLGYYILALEEQANRI